MPGPTVVTRDNFKDLLPVIKASIDAADFVSIDTELTGLAMNKAYQYHLLDTPEERYAKIRHSAMNFGLLQYGLAATRWCGESTRWITECWSFYLWPKAGTSAESNKHMTVQISSIEFLVKFGYDFNLTFGKGISYLSRAEEKHRLGFIEKMKETEEAAGANGGTNDVDISALAESDKTFLVEQMEGLRAYIAADMSSPYEVPPCNGYLRRLVLQEVPKRFANAVEGRVPLIVKNGKDRIAGLSITFLTPSEFDEHFSASYRAALQSLQDEVGFRHVLEHALAKGKPIIGHNCFMDFCHTFQKFIDRLPEDYSEFKGRFHGIFPTIFDTKHMAASIQELHGADSTSLGDLVHFFQANPMTSELCRRMDSTEQFHDAGFDAYCTAQVFLSLVSLIARRDSKSTHLCTMDILKNSTPYDFANRLFMMQSDCDGFNLAGPEDKPDRRCILHLSNFDPTIRNAHLQTAFTNVGFRVEARCIHWVDNESVFIRMASEDEVRQLAKLKHLPMPVGRKATIKSYEKHSARNSPLKRRLSSISIS